MKNKQLYISLLTVGMALGTAWAIRGQFGHEQGAAWAGGIGSLCVLLVSRRKDWLQNAFSITLVGALGWGVGGIVSYGIVVGYGRGDDFVNVYYGFLMLFLIGALYGLIGGGLFGYALSITDEKSKNWSSLIGEMVVSGLIFYFFMIEEFEWKMTPPRSELWAACLGMAFALLMNLIRNKHFSALRVAMFSGMGAGFGFAFGNFLQVMGTVSEIQFNFWNVMEYSIGFFGGIGMAYGTFTSKWEVIEAKSSILSEKFALIALTLVIPFIVWQQTFEVERISKMLAKIEISNENITQFILWGALILIVFFSITSFLTMKEKDDFNYNKILFFFFTIFGLYIIFSYLITGAFLSNYRIEQYLYFINFLILIFLFRKTNPLFLDYKIDVNLWSKNLIGIIALIAILAMIAINSHGELKGAKKRFFNENIEEVDAN